MDKIQLTAKFKIHQGKVEDFKKLAVECLIATKENDEGALQYNWFFDDNQSECVVQEVYVDSAAVLNHVAVLGPLLGKLMEIADFSGELYGNISFELRQEFNKLGVKMYNFFQGF